MTIIFTATYDLLTLGNLRSSSGVSSGTSDFLLKCILLGEKKVITRNNQPRNFVDLMKCCFSLNCKQTKHCCE